MHRIREKGLGLLLGAVVAVLAGTAWAQQTVSLCGQVTDATGAVIPRATVVIRVAAGGPSEMRTVADAEGAFRFSALEPGNTWCGPALQDLRLWSSRSQLRRRR